MKTAPVGQESQTFSAGTEWRGCVGGYRGGAEPRTQPLRKERCAKGGTGPLSMWGTKCQLIGGKEGALGIISEGTSNEANATGTGKPTSQITPSSLIGWLILPKEARKVKGERDLGMAYRRRRPYI